MSMELMAPPPGPSLRERIRRWLGIETDSAQLTEIVSLVTGQRRDFDQLGKTLAVKDQDAEAWRRHLASVEQLLGQAVGQLNQTTGIVHDLQRRLTAYERNVPQLTRVKRSLDEKAKRDLAAAKRMAMEAVLAAGGTSQEKWPFGPAPMATCEQGPAHLWELVALFEHTEVPTPTWRCRHCEWRWTRGWTENEFSMWLATQSDKVRERFEATLETLPAEIPYSTTPPAVSPPTATPAAPEALELPDDLDLGDADGEDGVLLQDDQVADVVPIRRPGMQLLADLPTNSPTTEGADPPTHDGTDPTSP